MDLITTADFMVSLSQFQSCQEPVGANLSTLEVTYVRYVLESRPFKCFIWSFAHSCALYKQLRVQMLASV